MFDFVYLINTHATLLSYVFETFGKPDEYVFAFGEDSDKNSLIAHYDNVEIKVDGFKKGGNLSVIGVLEKDGVVYGLVEKVNKTVYKFVNPENEQDYILYDIRAIKQVKR